MAKISIIIPVYKVAEYLPHCLDSVISQTLKDIEIICVNDGSPDNSLSILEEYAKKDHRIVILSHHHNKGLGPARNTGVAHATSPYISFVDSDDYIAPNMMEVLHDLITTNSAEMAWCGMAKVSEAGLLIDQGRIPEGVWSVFEVLKSELLFPSIQVVCNKLFRRDLIKGIKQLPILVEDEPAIAEYLSFVKRIVTTSESLYFYRHTPASLSNPSSHKADYWDHFFHDYNLYFTILRKHFPWPAALRKQLVFRHRAMLWRIDTFRLLSSESWKEQENRILQHLSKDAMQLRKSCPVMYNYLILLFRSSWNFRVKNIMLKIALKLSHRIWLNRRSSLLLPIDLAKILIPNIKFRIAKMMTFLEIFCYKVVAKGYKFFLRKNIWLIGERRDTAQENGIYFFKYINREYPEERSYYIIDKNCNQYQRVKNHGKVVHFGSLFHRILFFACKYYVTAHNNLCFPNSVFSGTAMNFPTTAQNIFLDHGITYADVSDFYGKHKSTISLFLCGAKSEYEYVVDRFGYDENEVAYTGFARFDGLHGFKKKRLILLMPTWRRNIIYSSTVSTNCTKMQKTSFMNSRYYKQLQQLINMPALHKVLEEFNYELYFFPHYEIQKYLSCFTSSSSRVSLISNDDFTVQDLLKESALLIVDTSSVSFDFAYMFKPLIYFSFDKEDFEKSHLKPGYFDHETMGFGPVIRRADKLIVRIAKYLRTGCQMEDLYRDRVKDFYPLHDKDNCSRIYQAILKYN